MCSVSITIKTTYQYNYLVDQMACLQSCNFDPGQCSANFSGNSSGIGQCSQQIINTSTYQLKAPQPKQIMDSFSSTVGMLCVQLDGEFCYPHFVKSAQQVAGADLSAADTSFMDSVCSPCTTRVLDSLGLAAGTLSPLAFFMDMACTKAGANYCYPPFAALALPSASAAPLSLASQEALLCSGACVPSVFLKFDNYLQVLGGGVNSSSGPPSYAELLEAHCSNDGSDDSQGRGNTCIRAMGWSAFSGPVAPAVVDDVSRACGIPLGGIPASPRPAFCGSNESESFCDGNMCSGAMKALLGGWGCCVNSFTAAFGIGEHGPLLETLGLAAGACEAGPVPPPCGVSAEAMSWNLCIGMPNLRCSPKRWLL